MHLVYLVDIVAVSQAGAFLQSKARRVWRVLTVCKTRFKLRVQALVTGSQDPEFKRPMSYYSSIYINLNSIYISIYSKPYFRALLSSLSGWQVKRRSLRAGQQQLQLAEMSCDCED